MNSGTDLKIMKVLLASLMVITAAQFLVRADDQTTELQPQAPAIVQDSNDRDRHFCCNHS